jgi:hypothetical protein
MKKNFVIVLTLAMMLCSMLGLSVSADTGAVTTTGAAEVTGIWSNLGTNGIIGIAVAAVVLVAAIVLIVVLSPKKHSK